MRLTLEEFKKLFPRAKTPDELYKYLSAAMKKYEVTKTDFREAFFLGQMAHETGGFRWLHELGSKSYFRRYDGRRDLGNVHPGDGYRFRGRGIIHLTGRHNYTLYTRKLGIDLLTNPDIAATPEVAALVAGQYWVDRNLNKLADDGNFRAITKRINGGYNGYRDRVRYANKIHRIIKGRGPTTTL